METNLKAIDERLEETEKLHNTTDGIKDKKHFINLYEKNEFEEMLEFTIKEAESIMMQKNNAINIEENIREKLGKVNEITRKELERYIDEKVKYTMRYFYKKGVRDGMYFSKLISSKE